MKNEQVRRVSAVRNYGLFALVVCDAVLLAVVELFFLPLRLDGRLLPKMGDFPLPITVMLAAITTPYLVIAAARYVPARWAVAPVVVWVVTVLAVGVLGPGSDVVLTNDWRSPLLLMAGTLPAAFVVGRRGLLSPRPHAPEKERMV